MNVDEELMLLFAYVESLLHKFRKRSPRYGTEPTESIPWRKLSKFGDSDTEAFALNQFLLDGVVPSGVSCQFRGSNYVAAFPKFPLCDDLAMKDTVEKIVRFAVTVRRPAINGLQFFLDGNHRTAILLIYELLAEYKIRCLADPVRLYILISNRKEEDWDIRIKALVKEVKRTSRKLPYSVSDNRREHAAFGVKILWRWNTLFEELFKQVAKFPRSSEEERNRIRRALHYTKKKSPKRYHQWKWLYQETE
jgi:hypothetical protein